MCMAWVCRSEALRVSNIQHVPKVMTWFLNAHVVACATDGFWPLGLCRQHGVGTGVGNSSNYSIPLVGFSHYGVAMSPAGHSGHTTLLVLYKNAGVGMQSASKA